MSDVGAAGRAASGSIVQSIIDRERQRWEAAGQLALLARQAGAGLVGAVLILHVVSGLAPIAFMVGIGVALQHLAGGGVSDAVTTWLGLALGAFVLQQILAPVQLMASREIARRVDRYCLTRFMRFAVVETPLEVMERSDVADRLSLVDEKFEQWTFTPGAATEGGLALTARYTQLAGAVVVLAVTAGIWPAIIAAVVALVIRRGRSEAFFHWGRLNGQFAPLHRRTAYVRELATSTRAAKDIRTLGLAGWIDERFATEARGLNSRLWYWRRRLYGRPFVIYTALAMAGAAAALLIVARAADGGVPPPAQIGATAMAVQALALCARFGIVFQEVDIKMVFGREAWQALLEIDEISREVVAGQRESRTGAAIRLQRVESAVRFEGAHFGYRPEQPVIDGLDLQLRAGTSTAIVGVNGAGKTTLVKLLAGLYRPDAGAITVDGHDLRDVDRETWTRALAVTFQDFIRYEMSLRDNVAMSAIEHRDDSAGILAELERVGLGELAASLPDGLETPLTRALPGGRELSGGQWQRLAMARSLFAVRHGASVLVLDEPTSQLDARGEAEFYDRFLELTQGVTSVIISHRFSSVRRADRIVVLDGGRVTEAGSHDELVAAGGTYGRMFAVQARRFEHAVADDGRPGSEGERS
ncbi:ABC transporter ATP-binding protein [Dactylosporangium matsuzakiense]|uniref:Multidrug ABC transporter permease n=1 Tax=Dactylosporangium matsuzakiense TaxID=53360 RepID=A0A9W6KEG0_9ACTN|nr:ABC transporter ATP-binding protein [Dactylosporangium matsuzakiense]GLK99208.1 multidrug ABC transporter permease [Dactylosporangium matsuzakiense]